MCIIDVVVFKIGKHEGSFSLHSQIFRGVVGKSK